MELRGVAHAGLAHTIRSDRDKGGEGKVGKLDGKVCIVTGGAGSLGLATARLFMAEGAKVMLVDLRADDHDNAVASLDRAKVGSV